MFGKVAEIFEENIPLSACLGPFLLLITCSVSAAKIAPYSQLFTLLIILGGICCWSWHWRGLLLSSLLLIIATPYLLSALPHTSFYFLLVAIGALLLDWVVIVLCAQEIDLCIDCWREQIASTHAKMAYIDAEAKEQNKLWQGKYEQLQGKQEQLFASPPLFDISVCDEGRALDLTEEKR